MRLVKAVYLDESDVTNEEWPFRGLKDETFIAVCDANIVIYRDRVVKNRCGGIGRIVPIVQPVAAGVMTNPNKDGLLEAEMAATRLSTEEMRKLLTEIRDSLRGVKGTVTVTVPGDVFADAVVEAIQRNRRVIGTILGDA